MKCKISIAGRPGSLPCKGKEALAGRQAGQQVQVIQYTPAHRLRLVKCKLIVPVKSALHQSNPCLDPRLTGKKTTEPGGGYRQQGSSLTVSVSRRWPAKNPGPPANLANNPPCAAPVRCACKSSTAPAVLRPLSSPTLAVRPCQMHTHRSVLSISRAA